MNFFESKSGSHEKNTDAARLGLPQSLVVDQRGPVTLLKLSRPAKRNALDDAMIAGIEAFFTDRRGPVPSSCTVPYFPLGGFNPLQSSILSEVAARLDATPTQVTSSRSKHSSDPRNIVRATPAGESRLNQT
jgi:hypothetical protein